MHHISDKNFKQLIFFRYVNNVCAYYMRDFFEYASKGRMSSRNNYTGLKFLFEKHETKKPIIYWSLSMEQISGFSDKRH